MISMKTVKIRCIKSRKTIASHARSALVECPVDFITFKEGDDLTRYSTKHYTYSYAD
jgi:hypothetical protein